MRLTTMTWNNQQEVLTLKLDDTYWPAWQIQWQDGEWRRTDLPWSAERRDNTPLVGAPSGATHSAADDAGKSFQLP